MPISKKEAQDLTRLFVNAYPGAKELAFNFGESTDALYGKNASKVSSDMKGGYLRKDTVVNGRVHVGRIDVVLGNINNASDFLRTLRHEVLGHHGFEYFDKSEQRSLIDALVAARDDPSIKPIWDSIDKRYSDKGLTDRAGEVFSLYMEGVDPQNNEDQVERGSLSFEETCNSKRRVMNVDDLFNIANMVAVDMQDRTRKQDNLMSFSESAEPSEKTKQSPVNIGPRDKRNAGSGPRRPMATPVDNEGGRTPTVKQRRMFADIVTDKLLSAVRRGMAPWQKLFGGNDSRMPLNPVTGDRYKAVNAIHLVNQGYKDHRWLTRDQVKTASASVRNGEKGTPVQVWKYEEVRLARDLQGNALFKDGEAVKERVKLERPKSFLATVFNAEQLEGMPELKNNLGDNDIKERKDLVDGFLNSGVINFKDVKTRSTYTGGTDRIVMQNKSLFENENDYYAESFRAISHWTSHSSRLDRDQSYPFGSDDHARELLRSEIAAMMISAEFGIEYNQGQPRSFTKSLTDVLAKDPLEIFRASADAEKIKDFVVNAVQQQQQNLDRVEHNENVAQEDAKWAAELSNAEQTNTSLEEHKHHITQMAKSRSVLANSKPDGFINGGHVRVANIDGVRYGYAEVMEPSDYMIYRTINGKTEYQAYRRDWQSAKQFIEKVARNEEVISDWVSGDKALATLKNSVASERDNALEVNKPRISASELPRVVAEEVSPSQDSPKVDVRIPGVKVDFGSSGDFSYGHIKPEQGNLSNRDVIVYREHKSGKQQYLADAMPAFKAAAVIDSILTTGNAIQPEPWVGRDEVDAVSPEAPYESMYDESYGDDLYSEYEKLGETVDRAVGKVRDEMASRSPNKVYLAVPNNEWKEAEQSGAEWDDKARAWYVGEGADSEKLERWSIDNAVDKLSNTQPQSQSQSDRVYLAVPYGEREEAGLAGAEWDEISRSWYVGEGADSEKLERWSIDNVKARQDPATNPVQEFDAALKDFGLIFDGEPVMDGTRVRCMVDGDRPGQKSGFYFGYTDDKPGGFMMNNKSGEKLPWRAKGYKLTEEQKALLRATAAGKAKERAKEQKDMHDATVKRLAKQRSYLSPLIKPTPYQINKGVSPQAGALTDKNGQTIFLPATDVEGKIWSMQYIQSNGDKRYAKESKKEGSFHVVGGDLEALSKAPIIIACEGYATGSSAVEVLGIPVAACFDAGNVKVVVKALHDKFPDKPVLVLGEDDQVLLEKYGRNVGMDKAIEAAEAVGGKAIFPVFAPGEQINSPKDFTDFNDLANKSKLGAEGLKRQLVHVVNSLVDKAKALNQKLTDPLQQDNTNKHKEDTQVSRANRHKFIATPATAKAKAGGRRAGR